MYTTHCKHNNDSDNHKDDDDDDDDLIVLRSSPKHKNNEKLAHQHIEPYTNKNSLTSAIFEQSYALDRL